MVNCLRVVVLCCVVFSSLGAMEEEMRGRSRSSSVSSSPHQLSPNDGRSKSFGRLVRSLSPDSCNSSSSEDLSTDDLEKEENFKMVPFDEGCDQQKKIAKKPSYFFPHEEDLALNRDQDDSPLNPSPFKSDHKEKSVWLSQLICCCNALKELNRFICNAGCCCWLSTLLKHRPEEWAFEWAKRTDTTLKQVGDEKILKGSGGIIFWDCRNSSDYCTKKVNGWGKFPLFMNELTRHFFLPIGEKYNVTLVGMSGDGPLLVRPKKNGETDDVVAQDTVLAAIELIARYPTIKKEFKLRGPEYCGVGCSQGEYSQDFTPMKKNSCLTVPALTAREINAAFFNEQANKQFGSALIIDDHMHERINTPGLRDIYSLLTCKQIKTKMGSANVWVASHEPINALYDRITKANGGMTINAIKQDHNDKQKPDEKISSIKKTLVKEETTITSNKVEEVIEITHYN